LAMSTLRCLFSHPLDVEAFQCLMATTETSQVEVHH
jgi:hypothetical protein